MPMTDIIVVSIIALTFIVFAAVLAWGDHQTREIARASRERALTGARVAAIKQNAAAEAVACKAGEESKAPVQA